MCSYSSLGLRGVSPHSLSYLHINIIPICKKTYKIIFIDVQQIWGEPYISSPIF